MSILLILFNINSVFKAIAAVAVIAIVTEIVHLRIVAKIKST